MIRLSRFGLLALLLVVVLGACQDPDSKPDSFTVIVEVDGERLVYRHNQRTSVGQFLQDVGIVLSENDEVNPLLQSQIHDNTQITITRVELRQECREEVLPFERVTQPTQNLAPGDSQLGQPGVNGILQVCYRITLKDGEKTGETLISSVPIKDPVDEIVFVGSEAPDTLVPIEGILTFISGGQAWIIAGNTASRSPLSEDSQLDGRVFALSPNGRQLLYTRRTPDATDPEFSNELWVILDTTAPFPQSVALLPEDVRTAQWVPGQRTSTFSYSTASPTSDGAGWRAYNDLYLVELDPETGETLARGFKEVISSNALGAYAYWGRRFAWSPDGTQLAWANADGIGTVDLETGDLVTLLNFREYAPLLQRFQGAVVWVPTLSWSEEGHLITTVHGLPYADEAPENSIIFDTAVLDVNTGLQINPLFPKTGIWASPAYSPAVPGPEGSLSYSIAYFQAREPLNSPGTQYDLVIADRDGSNARVVFPGQGMAGLRSPDPEDGIAWSPTARQIAVIYGGDLWIIEVKTGQATQITSDGQSSRPRWSRTR